METSTTLIASAYERLRADVLSGRLAPGQKLGIESLRDQYDTGATPVREALNRLAAEGWVLHLEQRGFAVAPVSEDALRELAQTRVWVETLALRKSMERKKNSAWEEGVVLALHRLSKMPRSLSTVRYDENPEWEKLHCAQTPSRPRPLPTRDAAHRSCGRRRAAFAKSTSPARHRTPGQPHPSLAVTALVRVPCARTVAGKAPLLRPRESHPPPHADETPSALHAARWPRHHARSECQRLELRRIGFLHVELHQRRRIPVAHSGPFLAEVIHHLLQRRTRLPSRIALPHLPELVQPPPPLLHICRVLRDIARWREEATRQVLPQRFLFRTWQRCHGLFDLGEGAHGLKSSTPRARASSRVVNERPQRRAW